MAKTKETIKKIEKEKKKLAILQLVGIENQEVKFEEIKDLIDYMKEKNWQLIFRKSENQGWYIKFEKWE